MAGNSNTKKHDAIEFYTGNLLIFYWFEYSDSMCFAFSNIDRLRDFIKHVYVDRRFTGEKNVEKPPRAKMVYLYPFSV